MSGVSKGERDTNSKCSVTDITATKYQFQYFNKENISNIPKEFCASNSQDPVVLREVSRGFPQSPSNISVASGDFILKCVWGPLFRISPEIYLQVLWFSSVSAVDCYHKICHEHFFLHTCQFISHRSLRQRL